MSTGILLYYLGFFDSLTPKDVLGIIAMSIFVGGGMLGMYAFWRIARGENIEDSNSR